MPTPQIISFTSLRLGMDRLYSDQDVESPKDSLRSQDLFHEKGISQVVSHPLKTVTRREDDTINLSEYSKRHPRQTPYKSGIDCGFISENGTRQLTIHSDFFSRDVDVYVAYEDPKKQFLFRPSLIAQKLDCGTSPVGMFLLRNKKSMEGIYQATDFNFKPLKTSNIKVGAYFVSLEVCREVERRFSKGTFTRKRKERPSSPLHSFSKIKGYVQAIDIEVPLAVYAIPISHCYPHSGYYSADPMYQFWNHPHLSMSMLSLDSPHYFPYCMYSKPSILQYQCLWQQHYQQAQTVQQTTHCSFTESEGCDETGANNQP